MGHVQRVWPITKFPGLMEGLLMFSCRCDCSLKLHQKTFSHFTRYFTRQGTRFWKNMKETRKILVWYERKTLKSEGKTNDKRW